MSTKQHTPIKTRRRLWLRVLLIGVLLVAVGSWIAFESIKTKAVSNLRQQLAERGVDLQYASLSWSPWHGLSLESPALRRTAPEPGPLVELTRLHVDAHWRESWKAGTLITRWRTNDATLTFHDAEGEVVLKQVAVDFIVQKGSIQVTRLQTNDGTLSFDLAGKADLGSSDEDERKPIVFNLRPLRAVLSALNFKPGTGGFAVKGTVSIDARQTPLTWQADLTGKGIKTEWRGVPMEELEAVGKLSDAAMKVDGRLRFVKGSAQITLARMGWSETPLQMSGTLTDAAGKADAFSGNYQNETKTLTIASLSGDADLFELGRNMPALADEIPDNISFRPFPDIVAKDFVWITDKESSSWSLESMQLRKPARLMVEVRGKPLAIDQVSGALSRQEGTWHFDKVKGQLLGGSFGLDGNYNGRALSKATLSLRSLELAKLGPWLDVRSDLDNSRLSLSYRGSICSDPELSTGSGTLELTQAPVVQVPLLDQTYELFPKLIPDGGRGGTGECEVVFAMTKGIASIDPFKARSRSLTVTGTGTINLVKRWVDGEARANLRGLVGVATFPLSHVLTDMRVTGPLDNIRVTSKGPGAAAKGLVKGTVGTVTDGAKLSSGVLRNGLALPFEALGIFGKDRRQGKRSAN